MSYGSLLADSKIKLQFGLPIGGHLASAHSGPLSVAITLCTGGGFGHRSAAGTAGIPAKVG